MLFVAEESGKLIVIEGNRRLAAVKLLTDKGLRNRLEIKGLPTLSSSERQKLETLPVIECRRETFGSTLGSSMSTAPRIGIPSRKPSTLLACITTTEYRSMESRELSETGTTRCVGSIAG